MAEESFEEFLARARHFAMEAHGQQMYGDKAYVYHLDKAVDVLRWMGQVDRDILAAAMLHDVIEDTATNYNDVKGSFGHVVAELVYAVTDELGKNRHERHLKTYPKVRAAGARAVTLKLADRIANVEDSVRGYDWNGGKDLPRKLVMYRDEQREFSDALREVGGPEKAWAYLEYLLLGGDLRAGA